jgi:hypothetical protein
VNTRWHDLTGTRCYAVADKQHVSATALTSCNNKRVVEVVLPRSPVPGKPIMLQWNTWCHVAHINRRSVFSAARAEALKKSQLELRVTVSIGTWTIWQWGYTHTETMVQQTEPPLKGRLLPSSKKRPNFSNMYMSRREKNLGHKSQRDLKPRMTVLASASNSLTDMTWESQLSSETVSGSAGRQSWVGDKGVQSVSCKGMRNSPWGKTVKLVVRKGPASEDQSCGTYKLRKLRRWDPLPGDNRWRHSRLRRLSVCCSEL